MIIESFKHQIKRYSSECFVVMLTNLLKVVFSLKKFNPQISTPRHFKFQIQIFGRCTCIMPSGVATQLGGCGHNQIGAFLQHNVYSRQEGGVKIRISVVNVKSMQCLFYPPFHRGGNEILGGETNFLGGEIYPPKSVCNTHCKGNPTAIGGGKYFLGGELSPPKGVWNKP